VCVSNQPAAAKGKVAVDQLLAVHERALTLLAEQGIQVEISLLCLHHPDGVLGELSRPCACRKPAPGMLLDAAAELELDLGSSWMLGDTDTDIAAGHAAGARTVLIEYPPSAHKRSGTSTQELLATDIGDAAAQLLGQRAR
jgi:histidinol-phosphate phosphatase family protein